MWGLIKQGWKCKDCGISAHRLCKDRVVIECRSKRGITRQTSNSGNELIRNRSASNRSSMRKNTVFKQKATQTDNYEDIFMSDESGTSTEDNISNNNLFNSSNNHNSFDNNTASSSCETFLSSKTSENYSEHSQTVSQRSNRYRRHKKSPKRRKSLPPQSSSNDEPHLVTLIPRGPLICSNSENLESWLPERLFNQSNYLNNTQKQNNPSPLTITNPTLNLKNSIDKTNCEINDKKFNTDKNLNSITTLEELEVDSRESIFFRKSRLVKPIIKDQKSVKINNNQTPVSFATSNLELCKNIGSGSFINSKLGSCLIEGFGNTSSLLKAEDLSGMTHVNSDDKETPTKISCPILANTYRYNKISPKNQVKFAESSSKNECFKKSPGTRMRIESDYDINDFIGDFKEENYVGGMYSSNDEDNDVFIKKLKEEANVSIF